jgi:hypothetical protein
MNNLKGIQNVILGKNRLYTMETVLKLVAVIITIFVCYSKEFVATRTVCTIAMVYIIFSLFDILANRILDKKLEEIYSNLIKDEANELAEFFSKGKVRKLTHIKDVLKALDEIEH